jgi:hypothetical protein
MALRILSLCVLLAAAETLHGIARTVWLVPRVGKDRAQRWSLYSGCALALGLCAWQVPAIGLDGAAGRLALGAGLAAFMAAFDLAMGHWLLRRPWHKTLDDLDPCSGNRLLFGLVFLALCPWGLWWCGR